MPRAKKVGAKRVNMNLTLATRRLAEIAGDGDRTAGVERLFARLPLLCQVQRYLEARAEAGDPEAESLLHDMAGLECDRVLVDAIAEGVISAPGADGKSSAWTV